MSLPVCLISLTASYHTISEGCASVSIHNFSCHIYNEDVLVLRWLENREQCRWTHSDIWKVNLHYAPILMKNRNNDEHSGYTFILWLLWMQTSVRPHSSPFTACARQTAESFSIQVCSVLISIIFHTAITSISEHMFIIQFSEPHIVLHIQTQPVWLRTFQLEEKPTFSVPPSTEQQQSFIFGLIYRNIFIIIASQQTWQPHFNTWPHKAAYASWVWYLKPGWCQIT